MRNGIIKASLSLIDLGKASPEEIQKQITTLDDAELDKEYLALKQHLGVINSMITKMGEDVPDAVVNGKIEIVGLLNSLQEEKSRRLCSTKNKVNNSSEQGRGQPPVAAGMDYESEFRDILSVLTKLQGAVRALHGFPNHISEERIAKFTSVTSDYQLRLKSLYETIDSEIVKLQEDIMALR